MSKFRTWVLSYNMIHAVKGESHFNLLYFLFLFIVLLNAVLMHFLALCKGIYIVPLG